ncbi:MAG: hypothetical protein KF852_19655 [Saprospiraceae bacterium]|nr:hypothetical protein [Saprospiraceae bacterium]
MKTVNLVLFLLGASLFNLLNAQNDLDIGGLEGDFVVMRSFEVIGNVLWNSKLVISDGRGEVWNTELKTLRPKDLEINAKTIAAALGNIKKQGYQLRNVSTQNLFEGSIYLSEYLFERKEP